MRGSYKSRYRVTCAVLYERSTTLYVLQNDGSSEWFWFYSRVFEKKAKSEKHERGARNVRNGPNRLLNRAILEARVYLSACERA